MFKLLKFNSKQLFIKSLIINTFVTLFTIILPYITKLFIDNIELKNGHKVLLFGLANILIVLVIQVLYYFADLFQGKSELFVWDNISQITHKNLQSYDPTQYDLSERNISQMLGQNYELLKHFFNQYPVMLTLYVVRAVAIIGILFSISPRKISFRRHQSLPFVKKYIYTEITKLGLMTRYCVDFKIQ